VEGALVSEVSEGSAADKAGIKPGDIITSINGKVTRTGAALRAAIGILRVGDKVEVGLLRDGKPRRVTASIGEVADSTQAKSSGGANGLPQGLSGAELANNNGEGVLITAVADGSNAAQNGLRRNDVIVAVGRTQVNNVKELREAVKDANSFLLTLQRGNRTLVAVIR
jgi:S1-C subfamily serine protease